MISRLLRTAFFTALAFGFVVLFLLAARQAAPASAGADARSVLLQEATDYPYPYDEIPTDPAYPGETETPFVPTQESFLGTATPTPTPGSSPTPVVNVFGTEDAQMRDTLGNPVSSATPGPSITPANTETALVTIPGTVAADASLGQENNRFQIDWGFFWIGFAVPLLVCCGVVLYLLDRRPDLFSHRPKS